MIFVDKSKDIETLNSRKPHKKDVSKLFGPRLILYNIICLDKFCLFNKLNKLILSRILKVKLIHSSNLELEDF